ncbi:hypothetical protein ACFUMH_00100 [Cellulomonas sp. NPDC057328]|uniref:hypothetical protein n=1 Tax=Cellulomonas sp. NPDC057328 TaxID=3346101 RepID=UPI00363A76BB
MSRRWRIGAAVGALTLAATLLGTGAQALTVTPSGGPTCSMATTKSGTYARVSNQSCWRVQVRVQARDSGGTVRSYTGPISGHFSEVTSPSLMVVGYAGRGSNSSGTWSGYAAF